MKKIRLFSFFLSAIMLMHACIFYCAAESTAYSKLLSQDPVYIKHVTFDGVVDFYKNSSTDEILNISENNFIKGVVNVAEVPTECYVYMRTFYITDASGLTASQAKTKSSEVFAAVKAEIAFKYLKCITRSYSLSVSGVQNKATGLYTDLTLKIMIATGESNEERAEVIQTFVKPQVALWAELPDKDRFIALNDFLLNGQFSYDTSFINRSSIYAFLQDKLGVCEEFAGLTALFLDEMGYKNNIVMGHVGDTLHMWNTVVVNGRIYHLDVLHSAVIDEAGVISGSSRDYLLVSNETVLKSRTIESAYSEMCKDAIYNFAFENTPSHIVITDVFSRLGDMISHVPLFTTAIEFKALLEDDGFLQITQKNGHMLADEDYVGSGCVLSLNVNGVILEQLTIKVDGDVNGDGIATKRDLDLVSDAILQRGSLSENERIFCDITEDGQITVTDYLSIMRLSEATALHYM